MAFLSVAFSPNLLISTYDFPFLIAPKILLPWILDGANDESTAIDLHTNPAGLTFVFLDIQVW